MWKEKFQLSDVTCSVSNVQTNFKYIIKKHETAVDNSPIRIYVNKVENRIPNNIETGHYLETLTPETMKLLDRTRSNVTRNGDGEKLSHLETNLIKKFCIRLFLINRLVNY